MPERPLLRAPRAIVFDLDDTLTDRRASVNAYASIFRSEFSSLLAPDSLPPLADMEARLNRADRAGYNRRRPQDIVEAFEWRRSPRPEEVDGHWLQHFPSCSVPRSGLRETFERFKQAGVELGLVTNGRGAPQRAKLEFLGIQAEFRHLAISAEMGCEKPDPAIFEAALRGLGRSPEEAWFVGDHPEKDIAGANAAGISAIWVRASHPWPAAAMPPPHSIEALSELVPLFDAALAAK